VNAIVENISITWQEFIEINPLTNLDSKKYIYRGQTNGLLNKKFTEWEIISSFNRFYAKLQYTFPTFISQQITFMNSTYSEYEFVKKSKILNSNTISKIYFLQHYGIPTCFIDFTYNPLISLYFSISSLKGQSGGNYTVDGFPNYYPDDNYFTIIKIDVDKFQNYVGVKNLKHFNEDLFINYNSYSIEIDNNNFAQVALDLSPLKSIDNNCNYNLKNQSSCFLMFDNVCCNSISLERFLEKFINKQNIKIDNPFILKYHIKYNTAFKPMRSRQPNYISLFKFLDKNNITGKNLFNDIQGLKYDFNFFHHI